MILESEIDRVYLLLDVIDLVIRKDWWESVWMLGVEETCVQLSVVLSGGRQLEDVGDRVLTLIVILLESLDLVYHIDIPSLVLYEQRLQPGHHFLLLLPQHPINILKLSLQLLSIFALLIIQLYLQTMHLLVHVCQYIAFSVQTNLALNQRVLHKGEWTLKGADIVLC